MSSLYSNHFKRFFDICLILLFFPFVFIMIALISVLLIKPKLFIQERPGRYQVPFKLVKFRTMKNIYNNEGHLLPDEQRLTKFGLFLRKTSFDEIPSLINILKGEMSFVGPRPLLMEYLERYNSKQARRHEVRPGLTGWAQVNGRNNLTWDEKFELDVWYVDNLSLWLDIKIIFLTIIKVIKHEGINQPGHATMEIFNPEIKEKND